MPKCPSCKSSFRKRLARNFILKLIPKSKLYSCYSCKTRFIKIPYFFKTIVVKRVKSKKSELVTN